MKYGNKGTFYGYGLKEAQLIYEESLRGYKFKFLKGFSKEVVEILKKGIPSHERTTTGPPDWEWFIDEKHFNLIKLALEGAGFKLKLVTKEDVERLKANQTEAQKQAQERARNYQLAQQRISIDDEIVKFFNLVYPFYKNQTFDISGISADFSVSVLKELTREQVQKIYRKACLEYHPDRNPSGAGQMSELNRTWTILKEGYFIK